LQTLDLVLKTPRDGGDVVARRREFGEDLDRVVPRDSAGAVFLCELLSLLDAPARATFTCSVYTETDMFGGCERRYAISTGRFVLRREQEQEIRESWSSLDVKVDVTVVPRLPAPRYLVWNGECGRVELTVGNVPSAMADELVRLADELFAEADVARRGYTRRADDKAAALKVRGCCLDPVRTVSDRVNRLAARVLDGDEATALQAFAEFRRRSFVEHPGLKRLVPILVDESPVALRLAVVDWLAEGIEDYQRAGLRRALLDEHAEVRAAAVAGMDRRYDSDGVPALLHALEWGGLPEWELALPVLQKISRSSHVIDLDRVLGPGLADPSLAQAVMRVLGRFDHPLVARRCASLVGHPDGLVREAAVWAIGRVEDGCSVEELEAFLADDDERVRAMAWHACELHDLAPCRRRVREFDRLRRRATGDEQAFLAALQALRQDEPDVLQRWLDVHRTVCDLYAAEVGRDGAAQAAVASLSERWDEVAAGVDLVVTADGEALRWYDGRFDLYVDPVEPRPELLPFVDPCGRS